MAIELLPYIADYFVYIFIASLCCTLLILFSLKKKDGDLSSLKQYPVKHILLILWASQFIVIFPGFLFLFFVESVFWALMYYYQIHLVVTIGLIVSYSIYTVHDQIGIHASLPTATAFLMFPFVLLILGASNDFLISLVENSYGFVFAIPFIFVFASVFSSTSVRSDLQSDKDTRKRTFGNTYHYNEWSIGWLLIRLGNRVNLDNDVQALSALEDILKMGNRVLLQAIERVGIKIISNDDGLVVVNWKKRGEMRITSEGLLHGFRLQRFFMTNNEIQEYIQKVRKLYFIECTILLILTVMSFLFLTGSSQLFGVAIPLSLFAISFPVEQREVILKRTRASAQTIISFFEAALDYLQERKINDDQLSEDETPGYGRLFG